MDDTTLYRVAKRRLTRVARRLDADQLALTCPSCPAWSNQDVIAHHIHFLAALIDGTVPKEVFGAITDLDVDQRTAAGRVRDEWTQTGVDERRGRTLTQLLDEWNDLVAVMPANVAPTVDAVVHLGDVLEAVGERRGVDTVLVEDTLFVYAESILAERIAVDGASVTLRCVDTGTRIGAGPGAPEISGTGYELLRAIAGRRTRAEADASLDWGTAPASTRDAFSAYGWPDR